MSKSFDHFSGLAKKLMEQGEQAQQAEVQATAQAQVAKQTLISGTQDILQTERQLETMKQELEQQKADLKAYAEDISQYKRLNALDSYPNQA
jgi:chromosome segregation ATPase